MIKLRVWDKDAKQMRFVNAIDLKHHTFLELEDKEGRAAVTIPKGNFTEHFELMRSVGRLFKCGKEGYEGDIISFLPADNSTTIRQVGLICYSNKRSAFCVRSKAWDMPLFNCKDIEVIGNIHENPELLK